jgi:hypothetical protein
MYSSFPVESVFDADLRNAVSVSNPQDSVDTGDEHSVFKASMTGPVILRNDHRLMLPSYSYLSLESALSFADRISTPVYAIEGRNPSVSLFYGLFYYILYECS